ncbi:TRAP transporter large permease [Ornithinimicrobium humiphilum]|uniref:Tripartite ATP-independent transporter DctM subunit n=1 Tax=Ornithinimicrobium humiphilum TaxID=125288 RepID=A0A543KRR2_9MICO|nr:TRAP transporter large permease [Ornithinimicrobium humiphilum]TQM97766.1 tripartite ATP-independent transporter DctM subunit [Ornithinimicrobium humiphilum]
MSVTLIILIALGVFILLLAAEAPVAIALLAASITGLLLNAGVPRTAATLGHAAYQATSSYSLVVIPMFILMGVFVARSGILTNLFDFAARITRRLPGGIGVATVLSAAGFSAVTGSSAATVVTLGRLCVNEMRRHGYPTAFAASIVAASGTLGVLIPPSIVLVIYGILTNESVGQLLIAAVIPGILTAVAYIVTVMILARRQLAKEADRVAAAPAHRELVPAGAVAAETAAEAEVPGDAAASPAGTGTTAEPGAATPRGRFITGREAEAVLYIGIIAGAVLGGIYGGFFTETEAGAVGALLALVVLFIRSRQVEGGLLRALGDALRETAANTAMLVALLIAGSVFTLFLVTTRVPQNLTAYIVELDMNRYLVLAIILLVLLILGALIDGMSILLLTMPLTYPIMMELGFDGLWYGVIAVKMVEIGLLTPPFGLNVFMISGVVRAAKVESVFRGVLPFIAAEMVIVLLMILFPGIVTWLPSMAD